MEQVLELLPHPQAFRVFLQEPFGRLALPDLGIDAHFVATVDFGEVLV